MSINNKPSGNTSGCVAETAAELATTEARSQSASLWSDAAADGNTSVPHYWLLFNGAITGDDRPSPLRTLHLR